MTPKQPLLISIIVIVKVIVHFAMQYVSYTFCVCAAKGTNIASTL